jgi:hypothetical protein
MYIIFPLRSLILGAMGIRSIAGGCPMGFKTVTLAFCAWETVVNAGTKVNTDIIKTHANIFFFNMPPPFLKVSIPD